MIPDSKTSSYWPGPKKWSWKDCVFVLSDYCTTAPYWLYAATGKQLQSITNSTPIISQILDISFEEGNRKAPWQCLQPPNHVTIDTYWSSPPGLLEFVEDNLSISTELNRPAVGSCSAFHSQIGKFTKQAEWLERSAWLTGIWRGIKQTEELSQWSFFPSPMETQGSVNLEQMQRRCQDSGYHWKPQSSM